MADDADRSLVHELQMRKRQAWARTYDSHASDVFNFIAHLLHGDRAAAEEIHQNTWLAALAGIMRSTSSGANCGDGFLASPAGRWPCTSDARVKTAWKRWVATAKRERSSTTARSCRST